MAREQISWINEFKGVAAFMVFFVHCGSIAFPRLHFLFQYGNRGVELFFIITGFLFTYNTQQKSFVCWMIDKYIRIMPLSLITVAVSLFLNLFERHGIYWGTLRWFMLGKLDGSVTWESIIALFLPFSFLFMHELNTYVGMYFMSAIICWVYNKISSDRLKICIAVCVCAFSMIMMFKIHGIVDRACFITGIDNATLLHFLETKIRCVYSTLLGVILVQVNKRINDKMLVIKFPILFEAVMVIGLIGAMKFFPVLNSVIVIMPIYLMMICRIYRDKKIPLVSDVLANIGKCSYAFYYVHIPVTFFLYDYMRRLDIAIAVGLCISIFASMLIIRYIEKPIIRMLKTLVYTRSRVKV